MGGATTDTRRRAVWTVGDQGLSAVTNFALSVSIARTVSREAFGAYALCFAIYLIIVGISRSLTSDPLLVRFSDQDREAQRGAFKAATGAALCIGLVSAAICVTIRLIVGPGVVGQAIGALGLVIAPLLVQDAWRFCFFADGRTPQAALNDGVWAAAQVLLVGALIVRGHPSVGSLIIAWGLAGTAAAAFGVLQSKVVPSPWCFRAWLSENRHLSVRYASEFVAGYAATQVILFGLAAIAGLAAVGGFRAAQALLGPLNVLWIGGLAVAIPEAVRLKNASIERMRRLGVIVSGTLAVTAASGALAATLIPDHIGRAILGASWVDAHGMLLPLGLTIAGNGASVGAIAAVRAFERAQEGLRVRLMVAVVNVVITLGVGSVVGVHGAAWALCASVWFDAALWWRCLHHVESTLGPRRATEQPSHDGMRTKPTDARVAA